MNTYEQSTDVLVVGAGPAGLVTAIGLARNGVPALVVDRREEPSVFPRATGISPRTMEIMRGWGLEERVRDVGFAALPMGRIAPSLVAPMGELVPLGFPSEDEVRRVSPTSYAVAAQDAFEPVLAGEARALGSDVRLGTELVGLEQDGNGVTATLREVASGRRWDVRARYVVGADGAHSAVRAAAGISMTGPDHLEEFVTTLFRAPLAPHVGPDPYGLNMIPGPTGLVVMLPTGGDRWVLAQTWDPQAQRLDEFTPASMTETIRVASGVPDLPVQVVSTHAFSFAAQVADAYRSDRVFLVGDAAHRMTPRGGAGMNTAIHDAHNLAWKLAFVLRGWAGPGLLDTYERERRPVGEANTHRSAEPTSEDVDALAIDLGVTYEIGALAPMADGQEQEDWWRPSGRPGARLPHVWLQRGEERVSTLDLLGPGLTVLAAREGAPWRTAAPAASACFDVDVRVLVVGRGDLLDSDGAFAQVCGIDPDGAVLVRPDGHIAWRAPSPVGVDPVTELRSGIAAALGEPVDAELRTRGAA